MQNMKTKWLLVNTNNVNPQKSESQELYWLSEEEIKQILILRSI